MSETTAVSPRLTDAQLSELLALHQATTPYKWAASDDWYGGVDIENMVGIECNVHIHEARNNAQWIAAAHNAFPAIVAELLALRAERDAIVRAFAPVEDWYQHDEADPVLLVAKLADAVADLRSDRTDVSLLREFERRVRAVPIGLPAGCVIDWLDEQRKAVE